MKRKKGLALLVTAVMIAGMLGGCGAQETTEPSGEKNTENSNPQTEVQNEAQAKDEDVPTIVIYNNSGAFSVAGAEAGSDTSVYQEMQDYILEKTGVKVEIIMPPSDGAAATEKLNLLLAGGDQIDAWWGNWGDYAKDGIILPLTDYVKAPEAKALYDLWEPWGAWSGVTDQDGTIWAIPRMTDTTPYQVFVRNDWLDLVGMEMPETFDELNEYLYKIKDLDPYGNGETIPLILEKGGSTDVLDRVESVFLGGYVKTGNGKWLDDTDGKVKPEWIADGYVDFLKQLNQWYKDGIIHKESFTMDVDTIKQQIAKGAVGASAIWYSRIMVNEPILRENLKDFDRSKHTYVFGINEPGITGPNGNLIQTKALGGTSGMLISSKCKHPEAVMKFVEWSFEWENYTNEMYGLEGKYWKYNPDVKDAEKNKAVLPIEGGPTYARDFLVSLGLPLEIETTEYDDEGIQTMENLWLQQHLDDFDATVNPGIERGINWDTVSLAENIPTLNDLNTFKDEELVKFVNGTRSFDTWDKFIEECYQMGLDDYINEYTRQYNQLKEK